MPAQRRVPIVCDFRILDRLVHALPRWTSSCLVMAGRPSSLIRVLRQARVGEDDPGRVKQAFAVTERSC
eukprot:6850515-Pyramimonas_sp.AAC.1